MASASPHKQAPEQTAQAALEALIDRRLLLEEARKSGQMKDPKIMGPLRRRLDNICSFSDFENEMASRTELIQAWLDSLDLSPDDMVITDDDLLDWLNMDSGGLGGAPTRVAEQAIRWEIGRAV